METLADFLKKKFNLKNLDLIKFYKGSLDVSYSYRRKKGFIGYTTSTYFGVFCRFDDQIFKIVYIFDKTGMVFHSIALVGKRKKLFVANFVSINYNSAVYILKNSKY